MLNSIFLKNFKGFANIQIPLKPLTLFTGLNGSGKSSVLQAILLLKQSLFPASLAQSVARLNGELAQLGTAQDVFFQNGDEDEISVGLTEEKQGSFVWTFLYEKEKARTNDLLMLKEAEPSPQHERSPFQEQTFHYLQAERISPRVTFQTSNAAVLQRKTLGIRGEYAAHYLAEYAAAEVPLLMRHPEGSNPTLQQQTEAWLHEICPGTRLHVRHLPELDLVDLRYSTALGTFNTNPFRTTHTGFGITYVLPVLLALLSSKAGDLVLLENPEAHLHPQGQRLIGYLLGLASGSGVQVLVETHSDQVLSGVRLAIFAKKLSAEKALQLLFEKKESPDFFEISCRSRNLQKSKFVDLGLKGIFETWDEEGAAVEQRSAILQEAMILGGLETGTHYHRKYPEDGWTEHLFLEETDLAFLAGDYSHAKQLAERGLSLFPDSAELRSWEKVLAPSKRIFPSSTQA